MSNRLIQYILINQIANISNAHSLSLFPLFFQLKLKSSHVKCAAINHQAFITVSLHVRAVKDSFDARKVQLLIINVRVTNNVLLIE